ncbi:hypothetical protein NMY3_03412 [Candidatus Nitrosocosmicus oleophilus]|uniref:Uncharacterized protein n=1 Tax=Candidatus Nitrosocosmicus oleophilus TaxID=1353260 RepID=A0A654M2D8_9ARCH|nr:hypothetical protein [Candidatus Nitrosocosmicus oleophilus]ALI37595.1 hypothetical protein NMY3_03412 [Candidatus Nitrosocosmicus oleophilus]
MSKPISKGLFIVLTLITGVFMAPSLMFFGSVQATETITDFSDNANPNTVSDTSSSTMKSSSSNKGSITHVQAKNTQQSIYNCATGQKGVIISPGYFKVTADKKNGKWSGTISIKGSTGEKSGHIISGKANGISYTFKGNLDTKNTLCHFPGLQLSGTSFDLGSMTCGTLKTVIYTELSTGNTNHFKVLITCR